MLSTKLPRTHGPSRRKPGCRRRIIVVPAIQSHPAIAKVSDLVRQVSVITLSHKCDYPDPRSEMCCPRTRHPRLCLLLYGKHCSWCSHNQVAVPPIQNGQISWKPRRQRITGRPLRSHNPQPRATAPNECFVINVPRVPLELSQAWRRNLLNQQPESTACIYSRYLVRCRLSLLSASFMFLETGIENQ